MRRQLPVGSLLIAVGGPLVAFGGELITVGELPVQVREALIGIRGGLIRVRSRLLLRGPGLLLGVPREPALLLLQPVPVNLALLGRAELLWCHAAPVPLAAVRPADARGELE